MDLLSLRIKLHGFEKTYDPDGDGDCFYKAAAFQLGREGTELKNEIFHYLAQNQYDSLGQNRLDFLCSGDIKNQDVPSDWSQALTLLRSNWANEMVIRALCECLHCKITIITTSGETPDSYIKVITPPEQCVTPRHALHYGHTGNHYFALKEKTSRFNEECLVSCCSLIYSLNDDNEKVKACVDILCRYLDNICKNPENTKYHKIKQKNKYFQELVAPIKGATEFLLACGFEYKVLPVEGSEEKFFVFPKNACSDCDRLKEFKEVLISSDTKKPKLDRCFKSPEEWITSSRITMPISERKCSAKVEEPSPPDFDDKSNTWLQPHEFSTLLNFMMPVEYLLGDMYWWQEIKKAKQSDLDQFWSREHMTGSSAEGLCIPRSLLHRSENNLKGENYAILSADLDLMAVKETFVTINDEKIPIFDIARSGSDPRYVLLRLTEQWKKLNATFSDSVYLQQPFLLPPSTIKKIFGVMKQMKPPSRHPSIHEGIHGPARKLFIEEESVMSLDNTVVFEYPNAWPESAMDWLIRPRRSGWPSPALVQDIFDSGCHLAPVGRGIRACEPVGRIEYLANPGLETSTPSQQGKAETLMDESEWRISFSLAENKLGQSLSPGQRHIMVLLKIMKKAYLGDHDVISTYLLKNLFFWECENRERDFWREDNSAECLLSMLNRLVECLKKRHLPHYIIPESNLLMHEDPVKLAEAAETVLKVRESIFQKTVSFLTRLQSMMFQSREFFCDFYDSSVEKKQITNQEANKLYSLCQLYKKVIGEEHKKKEEHAMTSEQIMSIIDGCLSVVDILEQFFSERLFSQSSLGISDLFLIERLWSKYNDACGNEMTKIKRVFELTKKGWDLTNGHLVYAIQEVLVVSRDFCAKLTDSSFYGELNELAKYDTAGIPSPDKITLVGCLKEILLTVQKHKEKVFRCIRDFFVQLGNLAKLFFSNISKLRLCVHESLLARLYCKLWFANIGNSSKQNEETFTLFVREDLESCPHFDEKFIRLSLTFFGGMIMGRDSCELVPETTVMEQVKEIQESIAHETVKAYKTLYLLIDEFGKDDGVLRALIKIILPEN